MKKNAEQQVNSELPKNTWNYKDNIAFYEELPVSKFEKMGQASGLATGLDIKTAWPYICDSHSIIDIGVGYGRSCSILMELGYTGHIHGIEYSPSLCAFVRDRLGAHITLYEGDILSTNIPKSFDAALWLWSGISDFPHHKQGEALKSAAGLLSEKGLLVLDTMPTDLPLANEATIATCNQHYEMTYLSCPLRGYLPSCEDIDTYVSDHGLQTIKRLRYKTERNRERILHIIGRR